MTTPTTPGYLGIDVGTQGLSVILVDENLNVLATGEGGYGMLAGLAEGCYEQQPEDWESALNRAMVSLRLQLQEINCDFDVLAIGISGQMHGEVLVDEQDQPLGSARLWCDSRNEAEGHELTTRLGVKMPKRITAARWLWTVRNRPEIARVTTQLTTPAGWLAFCLTGQWKLGVGDASGMFPIDQSTLDYDDALLDSYDQLVSKSAVNGNVRPLRDLLPEVRRVGEDGGTLNENGARLLGLPIGIPVAPAEGDQPASLAGSLIGSAGMVSVSFGTSVAANSVGDRTFQGVSPAVDHFCAPDGKPINMVWLRNGTTFMNTLVKMFGSIVGDGIASSFEAVMPQVIAAKPDCGGLLALPFMDDEPGLGVSHGGLAMLSGLNPDNATAGNSVKAALLSTMFNLRIGSEVLDQQGFPRRELVLSGGLTNTPELAQVLADVFDTRVTLLESAVEGCAWGAALMAKFRRLKHDNQLPAETTWELFLQQQPATKRRQFEPSTVATAEYEKVYQRYQQLLHAVKERDSNP